MSPEICFKTSENRTSLPRCQKSHDSSIRGSKRCRNCSTVVPCSCQIWKLPAKQWRLPACILQLLCMVKKGALIPFFFFLRTLSFFHESLYPFPDCALLSVILIRLGARLFNTFPGGIPRDKRDSLLCKLPFLFFRIFTDQWSNVSIITIHLSRISRFVLLETNRG